MNKDPKKHAADETTAHPKTAPAVAAPLPEPQLERRETPPPATPQTKT
jgi:hypothetical protein